MIARNFETSMICYGHGPKYQMRDHLKKLEKRGDIACLWEAATEPKPGIIRVPYVKLRTAREVKRRAVSRVLLAAGSALVVVSSLSAAVWHARHVLLMVAGSAVAAVALVALLLLVNHRPGCIGLHCPGCKG
jgi:hypothetical protein